MIRLFVRVHMLNLFYLGFHFIMHGHITQHIRLFLEQDSVVSSSCSLFVAVVKEMHVFLSISHFYYFTFCSCPNKPSVTLLLSYRQHFAFTGFYTKYTFNICTNVVIRKNVKSTPFVLVCKCGQSTHKTVNSAKHLSQ